MNNLQDRESLRDLDGVRVAVEEASGIPAGELKTAVESQLRQAGIHVLNAGEFPVGDPYLSVRATASKENGGVIAYNVELSFVQVVFLRRNPAVTFNHGQTWKASVQVALAPAARIGESIRRELSRQVDQFIKDYLSVNPK